MHVHESQKFIHTPHGRDLFYDPPPFKSTQHQFSENVCSEDDLRSGIFGTLFCCKISCLPASPRIFEHLNNGIIAYFLTDFYPKKVT